MGTKWGQVWWLYCMKKNSSFQFYYGGFCYLFYLIKQHMDKTLLPISSLPVLEIVSFSLIAAFKNEEDDF